MSATKSWGKLISSSSCHQDIELDCDTFIIGRGKNCHIKFNDPRISSVHCIIHCSVAKLVQPIATENSPSEGEPLSDHGYIIQVEDKSSNGTQINGKIIGKNMRVNFRRNDRLTILNDSANPIICTLSIAANTLEELRKAKLDNNEYSKELES